MNQVLGKKLLWSANMSKEITNRQDIHENYLKEGDIVAEGILGEEI